MIEPLPRPVGVRAKFQATAGPSQAAPIGNRLYRRLAAGLAAEVACQYRSEQ